MTGSGVPTAGPGSEITGRSMITGSGVNAAMGSSTGSISVVGSCGGLARIIHGKA
jgi:hypothetical protein